MQIVKCRHEYQLLSEQNHYPAIEIVFGAMYVARFLQIGKKVHCVALRRMGVYDNN